MSPLRHVIALWGCLVAITACQATASRPSGTGCEATTRDVFSRFIRALETGAIAEAVDLVAAEPQFQWYSIGPEDTPGARLRDDSQDRTTLTDYLNRRARQKEHFHIVEITYNGTSTALPAIGGNFSMSNFSFWLIRRSNDLDDARPMVGKGAVNCAERKILVVTMNDYDPDSGVTPPAEIGRG
jgi:hypothetical protein